MKVSATKLVIPLAVVCWQGFVTPESDAMNPMELQVIDAVILECMQGDEIFLQSATDTCVVATFPQASFDIFLLAESA